jgi:hypothetical protein
MRSDARVKLSRGAITDGLGGKRRNRQPRIEGTSWRRFLKAEANAFSAECVLTPTGGILSLKVRGSAQLTASSLDYGRIRS